MMTERWRRLMAGAVMVAGVALAVVSAGPLSWGLGCVVAVAMIVGGWMVLTDRREPRPRRPYDREVDDYGHELDEVFADYFGGRREASVGVVRVTGGTD